MAEKSYLYLLIVSNFFLQEIIASIAVDDTRNSSDFLVRNKRVINLESDGYALARFSDINYILHIKYKGRIHAAGAILSEFTAITAASCVESNNLEDYKVYAGSGYVLRSKTHNVISKLAHYGSNPHGVHDGIALINVDPPFKFGGNLFLIRLHVEPIITGTLATISGWGCYHPSASSSGGTNRLRTITLPIMNHRECIAIYAGRIPITSKNICTYNERKLCAKYDIGTPLVVNKLLVGIHVYKGQEVGVINPDVFLDVQDPQYSLWIRENIKV